jgi:hypothetical protein
MPFLRPFPEVMKCVKHLTWFILIAGYHSHSEGTLEQLGDALKGFEAGLESLKSYSKSNLQGIPKLHMMRHYAECIRLFGTIDNTDTEQTEGAHSYLIKDAYRATNKRNYVPQMLEWEERLFKLKARRSLFEYLASSRNPIFGSKCEELISLPQLPLTMKSSAISGLAKKMTPLVSLNNDSHFRSINIDVVVLVRTFLEREVGNLPPQGRVREYLSSEGWLEQQNVYRCTGVSCFYNSHNNPDVVLKMMARCTEKWQSAEARYDYLLVQDSDTRADYSQLRSAGLIAAQIHAVFRLYDKLPNGTVGSRGRAIMNNFPIDMMVVETLPYENAGRPSETTGCVSIKKCSASGDFRRFKVLPVSAAQRVIHVCPTQRNTIFVINPYIDLESFNLIY